MKKEINEKSFQKLQQQKSAHKVQFIYLYYKEKI